MPRNKRIKKKLARRNHLGDFFIIEGSDLEGTLLGELNTVRIREKIGMGVGNLEGIESWTFGPEEFIGEFQPPPTLLVKKDQP